MEQSRPNSLLFSVLINAVLFSGIFAFGFPIFNSGDDVYLLYLSGGGFGQAPTELLHYNYGMHPLLGLMLKGLFTQFPSFNWYAALLYALHFAFCVTLLRQLLSLNNRSTALFIYGLVFFCIEARFLLQPTFTNTAMVAALAGVMLLHDRKFVLGYVLLLLALCLRVHMLIPVVVIAAPFFRKKDVVHLAGIGALAAIVIFSQEGYYKQRIPGWAQEEAYRQEVISHYNNVSDSLAFITNGILFDKEIPQTIKRTTPDFTNRLYWLFIENRIFIVLMLIILFYKSSSALKISALLVLGICMGLFFFKKVPTYLIPSCVLIWVSFSSTIKNEFSPGCLFPVVGAFLLYWSINRLDKLNNWNVQRHVQWRCGYRLINGSPNNLFVVSDDRFPMDYFHVWDTPHQFPVTNLLYKDHFLNNTYQPIYKKFNIASPMQFINNEQVIFTGSNPQLVTQYYELKYGIKTYTTNKSSSCIALFTVSKTP